MRRLFVLVGGFVLLGATGAFAQADEWNALPPRTPSDARPAGPDEAPPPPPPSGAELVTASPERAPLPPGPMEPATVTRPRSPLAPNTVSLFGGRTLGHLVRGEMVTLGFPLIGARLALGVGDRFDFGIGYQSFWFMMHELRVGFRVGLVYGTHWSLAAVADGSAALFTAPAKDDQHGPRWLTGRRNFNLEPGLVLSYQGDHPRAARLFFELEYLLTFDTEPFQRDPLGGVPARVQLGHNVLFHAGAEMPLSAKTSFVFLLGLDVHGRPGDAPVMPVCTVGIVTSF